MPYLHTGLLIQYLCLMATVASSYSKNGNQYGENVKSYLSVLVQVTCEDPEHFISTWRNQSVRLFCVWERLGLNPLEQSES